MQLVVRRPHDLVWRDNHVDRPGPGEVVVRTVVSAVSIASELSVIKGDFPEVAYPTPLGYQNLGVVDEVGEGASHRRGQRVVSTAGHLARCLHPGSRVVPVPDHVSDRAALALVLGEETRKGIDKVLGEAEERVLVVGAGLVGLLAVFNLTRRGHSSVTLTEPDPARRQTAALFGAASVVPGMLGDAEFDVIVECSASPAGFSEAIEHLRPGGRCVVLSDGQLGQLALPPSLHSRGLTVTRSSDGDDYASYARWLWDHADPVLDELFPETVPAAELPARLEQLDRQRRERMLGPVSLLAAWD